MEKKKPIIEITDAAKFAQAIVSAAIWLTGFILIAINASMLVALGTVFLHWSWSLFPSKK